LKKILKVLISRIAIICLLFGVQIAALILLTLKISRTYVFFYSFLEIFSICVVLYITSSHTNPSHKLTWVVLILIFPLFGGILYFMLSVSRATKGFRKRINVSKAETINLLEQDEAIIERIRRLDTGIAAQCNYISNMGFPVYKNTQTRYFDSGEEFFVSLIENIKKAKKFIFIEFFIINKGIMWNTVLSVLEQKVKEGVDVRIIYDDAGCLNRLPHKYYEKLRSKGIKCCVFNPFSPIPEIRLNHRDHRKIIVIDGYIAYTGGINLSDEYINVKEKYGHWKDAAVLVKGEAVWSLTAMFLQLWSFISGQENGCGRKNNQEDYNKFRTFKSDFCDSDADEFVQPFSDSPVDDEAVGENIYLNMILRAKKYVYIFTPYLVVDHTMIKALRLAAKSGVDVRIVTPHIPDKWYVFLVTQSYYPVLLEAGVRIYEYTPGFLHSKAFLCDDELAVVGTINLDFRSLYFHFECGIFLYKTSSINEIREDFLKTFPICQVVTLEDCKKVNLPRRILQAFLRLFAPLM